MAATLAAARGAWPDRRIVLAFQPHRYTRTRDCFEDRAGARHGGRGSAHRSLRRGRAALVAADGRALSRALRVAGKVEPLFVEDVAELPRPCATSCATAMC